MTDKKSVGRPSIGAIRKNLTLDSETIQRLESIDPKNLSNAVRIAAEHYSKHVDNRTQVR